MAIRVITNSIAKTQINFSSGKKGVLLKEKTGGKKLIIILRIDIGKT